MARAALIALASAALVPPPASAHPDSLSSSRIVVRGDRAEVTVRCQVLSLLEVLELDLDRDGRVSESEIARRADAIVDYVGNHYFLSTGAARDLSGGVALRRVDGGARFIPPRPGDPLTRAEGAVDVALSYVADEPIRDLLVEMALFLDTSPGHIDVVSIEWASGARRIFSLTKAAPRQRSDPSGSGVVSAFLGLGVRHILTGWDHLAFVGVLVLGARSLGSLLLLATAFTAAHSVTLALTALGVVRPGPWTGLIEAAVALSIAYVAADLWLRPDVERSRWPEAAGFGLLHGFAFAGFLGQSLVHEESVGLALLGFNLGIEAGQIAVVLVLAALLSRLRTDDGFLAPRWLRRSGGAAATAAGLWWFLQRL